MLAISAATRQLGVLTAHSLSGWVMGILSCFLHPSFCVGEFPTRQVPQLPLVLL